MISYDDWKTTPPEDRDFDHACAVCDAMTVEEIQEDLVCWGEIEEGHHHTEEAMRELWIDYRYWNPVEPDPDLGRDDC